MGENEGLILLINDPGCVGARPRSYRGEIHRNSIFLLLFVIEMEESEKKSLWIPNYCHFHLIIYFKNHL